MRKFLAVVGLCLAVAGCAVTTIDVDVYKGPLANEEDVQMQQLIAMAMASQPLLLRLRCTLEVAHHQKLQTEKVRNQRNIGGKNPDCSSNDPKDYQNEYANQVNAILTLYRDVGSTILGDYLTLLRQGLDEYKHQVSEEMPRLHALGPTLWPTFEAQISPAAVGKVLPLKDPARYCTAIITNVEANNFAEINKYSIEERLFLFYYYVLTYQNSQRQKWKSCGLTDSHNRRLASVSVPELAYALLRNVPSGFAFEANRSRTWVNEGLADPDIVKAHLSKLVGNSQNESVAAVVAHVTSIGRAYRHAETALKSIFEETLNAIDTVVARRTLLHGPQYQEVLSGLAEVVAEVSQPLFVIVALCEIKVGDAAEAVEAGLLMARVENALVQLRTEKSVVNLPDCTRKMVSQATDARSGNRPTEEPPISGASSVGSNRLEIDRLPIDLSDQQSNVPGGYAALSTAISNWIIREPQEAVGALRATHRYAINKHVPTPARRERWQENCRAYDAALLSPTGSLDVRTSIKMPCLESRFLKGLARGVSLSPGERDDLYNKLERPIGQIERVISRGLERGRLPEGLGKLADNFVKLQAARTAKERRYVEPSAEETRRQEILARENLLDALVQFAEKTLVVGQGRHLFTEEATDPATKNALASYGFVLETVGNGILVHVNARRHRDRMSFRAERNAEPELKALRQAIERPPLRYLADLTQSFDVDASQHTTAATKAGQARDEADQNLRKLLTQIDGETRTTTPALSSLGEIPKLCDPPKTPTGGLCKKVADARAAPNLDAAQVAKLRTDTANFNIDKTFERNRCTSGGLVDLLSTADLASDMKADAVITRIKDALTQAADTLAVQGQSAGEAQKRREIAYLNSLRPKTSPKDDKPEAIFLGEICPLIRTNLKDTEADLQARGKSSGGADTALQAALRELQEAIKAAQAMARRFQTLSEEATALSGKATAAQNVKAQLEQRRASIVESLLANNRPYSGRAVHEATLALLRAELQSMKTKSPPDTQGISSLQATIDGVSSMSPPVELGEVVGSKPLDHEPRAGETAIEVLDRLIALLREEHILALRSGQANAADIARALEAANEHRSSMVYIRPTSAYLRSSILSSSLQDDPDLYWQNLLGESAKRASPLFSETLVGGGQSERERRRLVSTLDKQYWQTVNSVRVSGAGTTNYVIAKDDVGNWYVKNYAADSTPITQSAFNLAKFALGPKVGSNLLARKPGGAPGETQGEPAQDTALGRLIARHQATFEARNDADIATLQAVMAAQGDASLAGQIQGQWQKADGFETNRAVFVPLLQAEAAKLELAAKDLTKTTKDAQSGRETPTKGERIGTALNAIRRFQQGLDGGLAAPKRPDGTDAPPEAQRNEARRLARGIVGDRLDTLVTGRAQTLDEFGRAISFVGEVANEQSSNTPPKSR